MFHVRWCLPATTRGGSKFLFTTSMAVNSVTQGLLYKHSTFETHQWGLEPSFVQSGAFWLLDKVIKSQCLHCLLTWLWVCFFQVLCDASRLVGFWAWGLFQQCCCWGIPTRGQELPTPVASLTDLSHAFVREALSYCLDLILQCLCVRCFYW